MRFDFSGAPWRENGKDMENTLKSLEGIRRKNGSSPSLIELEEEAKRLVSEAEGVGLNEKQLLFFLRNFELKPLKPKKERVENHTPNTDKPKARKLRTERVYL